MRRISVWGSTPKPAPQHQRDRLVFEECTAFALTHRHLESFGLLCHTQRTAAAMERRPHAGDGLVVAYPWGDRVGRVRLDWTPTNPLRRAPCHRISRTGVARIRQSSGCTTPD